MRGLWKWFADRWPFYPLRDLLLKEEIPGGASFAYTLGSSVLMIFTLQIASGILQLFYYVPTTDHAYDSVSYLRTEVPFGWLVHNMHYWGAQAMVLVVVLHMLRVYIWGAYKKTPLTWFIGVALIFITMAMSFTGAPLIWDQAGYWAGEVGSSIAGEVPLIGGIQKIILRGGETMGQLALSRFFAFHIWVFAPLLALLIGAHIAAFRTSGVGGPWVEEKRKRTGPFWPDQAFKDLVTATVVFLGLITLSVFFPVSFTGAADTLNTSYIPKPEWNFLFLYQALKYFKGPWEPIGAAGVPAAFIILLLAVPVIDRYPERNPFRRPIAMACLAAYVGVLAVLSIIGYLSPGLAQMPVIAPGSPPRQSSSYLMSVAQGAPVPTGVVPHTSNARKPQEHGRGGEADRAGKAGQRGAPPGSQSLPSEEKALEETTGRAAFIIGSAENGADLYEEECVSCHGPGGKDGVPNPGSEDGTVPPLNPIDRKLYDKDPKIFAGNIDKIIQHGSVPEGPHPALRMPAWGDSRSLTQQKIANLEAYILKLNGVNRAQLVHPGMQPKSFLLLVGIVYILTLLLLGGLRSKRSRKADSHEE
ncbi:MAG: cytochrome b N-terminal domain-containing protein [Nitrospirae bacterium]|nr:cytochrome b N-terminal domain-containing protein [Nitrospirota bacterium]